MAQLTPFGIGRFNKNSTQQLSLPDDVQSLADENSKFHVLRSLKQRVRVTERSFFDQFYIIGITEEQLLDRMESPESSVLQVPPQHLYAFHEDPECRRVEKEKHEMLLDFAFPTGVSAQKLNLNSPYYEQKAAAEADL